MHHEVRLRGGAVQLFERIPTDAEVDTATARKPSLCVVNYNGAGFLADTLDAAVSQAASFCEILMVDNGSSDDSVTIARRFTGVDVVELGENRGASAVRNAALARAASDVVILVDSDVRLAPECASRLVEAHAAHERIAAAMPRVLYDSDRERIQYDGADWHFLGLQSPHRCDRLIRGEPEVTHDIGSLITACCLVDRSRTGPAPFDEDFFIYLEDHDFGVRMRSAGHRLLSVPSAHCYHAEGTPGLSIRALGGYSSMRVFCLIRNRWQFIAKSYSARTLRLLAPLLLLYELAQIALVIRKGWFREWARAVGWMIRHGPDLIRRRRRVQEARRLPDGELMSGGRIPFRDELAAGGLERRGRECLESVCAAYWRRIGPLV